MKLFLLIFSLLSMSSHAVVPKKPAAPRAVLPWEKTADLVQQHYNKTTSARFSFEQTYRHPFLQIDESSKGVVTYIKSTGSMMWDYQEPKTRQKKLFINKNKFTYYADKAAYTHNCYDKDALSSSVTFLLGTGNIREAFTISIHNDATLNKSLTWLNLVPKEKNPPIKNIFLGVAKDGKVMESIVIDRAPSSGKNHYKFIDFKINPKPPIDPKIFEFVAPPGVLVQNTDHLHCPTPVPAANVAKQPNSAQSKTTSSTTPAAATTKPVATPAPTAVPAPMSNKPPPPSTTPKK